jgi:hypothetical protein
MFTEPDAVFIALCLEGFFYGEISVLCALTCTVSCTLAKEVQLLPGLGLYSGIFAMYLQCPQNKSGDKTTSIIFYALCLLYVSSTVTVVLDISINIIPAVEVSSNSICKNIIFLINCAGVIAI